jgi:formate hydrogenlyase subunit 6/NADH:ubiquinone oxidoreductase subunit I
MRKPGAMLSEVLPQIFRKPATSGYPFVKVQMPDHFRGKLVSFDAKCVGCKICIRDCPAKAITLTKLAEKKFEISIDLARCIYCAQCVDSCPRKALESSQEFELASLDRATLMVRINIDVPTPAPVIVEAAAGPTTTGKEVHAAGSEDAVAGKS